LKVFKNISKKHYILRQEEEENDSNELSSTVERGNEENEMTNSFLIR